MKRSFSSPRTPKRYVWVRGDSSTAFSTSTIGIMQLVNGADFSVGGGLGAEARVCNIKRIIGDVYFAAAFHEELDNGTDTLIAGPVSWGIFLQDLDAPTVDPDSGAAGDETCLGIGLTETIGIGIDSAAFVSGTGLAFAYQHQFPFSTVVHLDIHSNRRLSNDQELTLSATRPSATAFRVDPAEEYIAACQLRVLIQLP